MTNNNDDLNPASDTPHDGKVHRFVNSIARPSKEELELIMQLVLHPRRLLNVLIDNITQKKLLV